MNFNSNRSYKHLNLTHAHNFRHMNFYLSHAISLQKLSNERSYKFSWILTLTEVISIWILRMRIIYTIMNFYWSMLLPFKNCPRSSYKFSWILTLTEVISIWILRMPLISAIWIFICPMVFLFKNCQMNVLINLVEF